MYMQCSVRGVSCACTVRSHSGVLKGGGEIMHVSMREPMRLAGSYCRRLDKMLDGNVRHGVCDEFGGWNGVSRLVTGGVSEDRRG